MTTATLPAPAPVAGRRRVRGLVAACGPAFVVSVAYVDPGNFATNATAGARYGPMLLWVIAVANLLATGIVGATVMPHVVYLHSALARESGGARRPGTGGWAAAGVALREQRRGIVLALGLAGAVNMAILLVAAEALGGRSAGGSLGAIHAALGAAAGPVAAAVFALALLASGLASSSVGTYAGQVIMDGFLRRRVPLLVRRAVTTLPPLVVLAVGVEPTTALVASQVALSFGIPFAVVPLVALTRCRSLMGPLANRRRTTAVAAAVAALITGLNAVLVVTTATS